MVPEAAPLAGPTITVTVPLGARRPGLLTRHDQLERPAGRYRIRYLGDVRAGDGRLHPITGTYREFDVPPT